MEDLPSSYETPHGTLTVIARSGAAAVLDHPKWGKFVVWCNRDGSVWKQDWEYLLCQMADLSWIPIPERDSKLTVNTERV